LPAKVALCASLLLGFAFGGSRSIGVETGDGLVAEWGDRFVAVRGRCHVPDGASDSTDDQKSTVGSNCRIANDDVFTPFSK